MSNEPLCVRRSCGSLNGQIAHALIEQTEYDDRYAELLAQSRAIEEQISQIAEQREQLRARKRELGAFYKVLKEMRPIMEFDEELWNMAVENVVIQKDAAITVRLKIKRQRSSIILETALKSKGRSQQSGI